MKTPEEIKRGLECRARKKLIPCTECAYGVYVYTPCMHEVAGDALAYIRQLEQEKVNLLNLCEQFGQCVICKHTAKGTNESPCCDCRYCAVDSIDSFWEWRGVEEDSHGQEEL